MWLPGAELPSPLESPGSHSPWRHALDSASRNFVVSEPIALAGPWRVEVGVRRDTVPDDVRVPFTIDASLPQVAGQGGI